MFYCTCGYEKNPVIIPSIEKIKEDNDLETLLNKFQNRKINIHVVLIPARCTKQLQILDLTINAPFKQRVNAQFEEFYANTVTKKLKRGVQIYDIQED